MKMRLCIINIKGGVGKTATAVNLATLLALQGNRVLLTDIDPQGNATKQFKLYNIEEPSVCELLTNSSITALDVIKKTSVKNLDLIGSNLNLVKANTQIALNSLVAQQNILHKKIEAVADQYDYLIIDCGHNMDLLTINGLVASDSVIVPIKIDQFAFDGLDYLMKQVTEVKDNFNERLTFNGALLTMYRDNKLDRDFVDTLSRAGIPIFKTRIRETVKVRESTFEKPVVLYDPKATASIDYKNFLKELIGG